MGGAIVGIDLDKAFDRVDRETVWFTMTAMGYPADFIRAIKTMYFVASAKILNGSRTSGEILGLTSLRQGCPLSMHLFFIYIEPLVALLYRLLTGIKLLKEVVRVRALVDDLTAFLSITEDFLTLDSALIRFYAWSGARLNRPKTKAMGLGTWENIQTWPIEWLTSTSIIELLGICFQDRWKKPHPGSGTDYSAAALASYRQTIPGG